MYHDETHFGITKLGSNMHPLGARGFYFCKNGSWTPCNIMPKIDGYILELNRYMS